MAKRILFVLDYVRESYFYTDSSERKRQAEPVFFNSYVGKEYLDSLRGVNLDFNNIQVDFAYYNMPEPKKTTRYGKVVSYKNPKAVELKPYEDQLMDRILTNQPDLVVPTGSISANWLLPKGNLMSEHGKPVRTTISSPLDDSKTYECWVMPVFSPEFISANPSKEVPQNSALMKMSAWQQDSDDELFESHPGTYKMLTDMNSVRLMFQMAFETDNTIGWDTEANTLQPDLPDARLISFNISWTPGSGYFIPLWHEQSPFSDDEIHEILGFIKRLMESDQPKVTHNGQYDMHFLMSTTDITHFNNVRDTKVGYYLEVDQEVKNSLRLSDLAYIVTPMGGYDDPLEEYKTWFTKKLLVATEGVLLEKVKQERLAYAEEHPDDKKAKSKTVLKKDLPDITLDDSDFEAIYGETDWTIPEVYKFPELDPDFQTWAINLAVQLINEYRQAKEVKNPVDGGNFNYGWIPLSVMSPYAAGDADATLRIDKWIVNRMKDDPKDPDNKLIDLYFKLYPKVSESLAWIEHNGIRVNREYMDTIGEKYDEALVDQTEKIREFPGVKKIEDNRYKLYMKGLHEFQDKKPKDRDPELVSYRNKYKDDGWHFSPTSPKDIQLLLFGVLKIVPPFDSIYLTDNAQNNNPKSSADLTWESYKTDKEMRAWLLDEFEPDTEEYQLAEALTDYSKIKTLRSNFTSKLVKFISPVDKCVHGSFNTTGTQTGRLSSNHPNQQQLPSHVNDTSRFDWKYPIKREFISRFPGGVLHNIDYANLEMRVMGLVTQEPSMIEAFNSGLDIHKDTAAKAYGIPYDEVDGDLRKKAKALGFG